MRRLPVLLLVALLAVCLVGPTEASSAEPAPSDPVDLPPGFTDGVPVGTSDAPSSEAPVVAADGTTASSSTRDADTSARATTTKYFGQGPWDALTQAAAATPRCTGLSSEGLKALVVSPIFKESSAATRPTSAPAPMTLSRYDEWNGVYSTTTNRSSNYGLYAFRDPNTAYQRAYWHPGIGIWQYDSAGVGAPYTAIETMDVSVVGADVARGMASRYCNPPVNVVGHRAPFTAQERRDAAWWPWWAGTSTRGCPLCQREFDAMTASTPYFRNISLVPGITKTGGAVRRSCTVAGQSSAVECWYVNPAVGVIEGSTYWATVAPDGNNSPTKAPTPLSKPFYVVKRDGREERYWLRADTGYGTDISASRLLGKNARPRSNQSGSGLTWGRSGLCDLTARRGTCGGSTTPPTSPPPPDTRDLLGPPSGIRSTAAAVNGSYRPVALDAGGDGKGDILWYAPGRAGDVLWIGKGGGAFASKPYTIDGTFDDVLPLDFDGNGMDDILWYERATGTTRLWRATGGNTFASMRLDPGKGKRPSIGDFDGDGRDDILWYGPGTASDAIWSWTGSAFRSSRTAVNGLYSPVIGDFDGNGRDDILWYAPGNGTNRVWLNRVRGGVAGRSVAVSGSYLPHVGDFDGDGSDDIVWYRPGVTDNSIWFGGPNGAFTTQAFKVNVRYTPIVADLGGDGRDDLIWYAAGGTGDLWTRWASDRTRNSVRLTVGGDHRPFVGAFSAGGGDGIFWYAPGATPDAVWWR